MTTTPRDGPTTTARLDALRRTPYRLQGRTVGEGIDCLGVVQQIAELRGVPVPDGWQSIRRQWLAGVPIDFLSGFPAGWSRVDVAGDLVDGDVLLFTIEDGHPGCAIVHEFLVWGANPADGVFAVPAYRWRRRLTERWRFDP